jgi:hypothetical protein
MRILRGQGRQAKWLFHSVWQPDDRFGTAACKLRDKDVSRDISSYPWELRKDFHVLITEQMGATAKYTGN